MEENLFIHPLNEYVKNININLIPFSIQKIFYNDEVDNNIINKKRTRKQTELFDDKRNKVIIVYVVVRYNTLHSFFYCTYY